MRIFLLVVRLVIAVGLVVEILRVTISQFTPMGTGIVILVEGMILLLLLWLEYEIYKNQL